MAQAEDAFVVALSGVTDLPAGKIAAVVTYLEMRAPPPRRPALGPWTLERISDVPRYRALYRRVGEPWLWFSRLVMPAAELSLILTHPAVEAFALLKDAGDIGILELDFRQPGEAEIAFFGVVPEAIGTGAATFLMDEAIARAFARPIERLWLHTCTLDHPRAVSFYRGAGFTPYKRGIEIADDPRATGHLPPEAGPGVPLVGGVPG